MLRSASSVIVAAILFGHAGICAAEKINPLGIAVKHEEASIAVDINARGQVAGIIQNVEEGTQRAILFDRQVIELGTLGGGESYTKGINASGEVVGTAQNSRKQWRAFIYSKERGMRVAQMQPAGRAGCKAGDGAGWRSRDCGHRHKRVAAGEVREQAGW